MGVGHEAGSGGRIMTYWMLILVFHSHHVKMLAYASQELCHKAANHQQHVCKKVIFDLDDRR